MVSDHYRFTRPLPTQWDWPTWQEYQELKRKAAEYDRIMNQPHCEKGDLEEFERKIEKHLNPNGYFL